LRKLKSEEVQENKVFHNAGRSVRVLRIKTEKPQSPPLRVVVFQELGLGNRAEERHLSMNAFCARYERKKR